MGNTGVEVSMSQSRHATKGASNGAPGVIARVSGSVGRVAASVRRVISQPYARRRTPNRIIVRTWSGTTRAADADRYLQYLQDTGLREYRETNGNRGVIALRRMVDGRADFLLISFWDSKEAIRRFSGDDLNRARFYPEDEQFLLDRDEQALHYELVFEEWAGGSDTATA